MRYRDRVMLFWLPYANAACCALNVAIYLGAGRQWWSASVAVLSGLVALIIGMQSAASTVRR